MTFAGLQTRILRGLVFRTVSFARDVLRTNRRAKAVFCRITPLCLALMVNAGSSMASLAFV